MYRLGLVSLDAFDGLMENLSLVFHGTLPGHISGDCRKICVLPLRRVLRPERFLLLNKPPRAFQNGTFSDLRLRIRGRKIGLFFPPFFFSKIREWGSRGTRDNDFSKLGSMLSRSKFATIFQKWNRHQNLLLFSTGKMYFVITGRVGGGHVSHGCAVREPLGGQGYFSGGHDK